jgi:hypothetical protein
MRDKPKIGALLVEAGVVDNAQLQAALSEQRQWGSPLGMTLVRMGFLEEKTLVSTLASQLKLPVVTMAGKHVEPDVLERVPSELAEKHRCIPLLYKDDGGQKVLFLGMEDPSDLDAVDDIAFRIGEVVKPVLIAPTELDEALHRHYNWAASGPRPPTDDADASIGEFQAAPLSAGEAVRAYTDWSHANEAVSESETTSPSPILRALAQLLVEKGVISREELVERIDQLVREDDGAS